MWNKIGGVIGVVAILALVVAVVQLVQSNNAAKVQDLAQTTQIAILEQQLDVNREMATLQANISKSGPTAMAVATRMAELESTAVALAMAQTSAKATTPVSPQVFQFQQGAVSCQQQAGHGFVAATFLLLAQMGKLQIEFLLIWL